MLIDLFQPEIHYRRVERIQQTKAIILSLPQYRHDDRRMVGLPPQRLSYG